MCLKTCHQFMTCFPGLRDRRSCGKRVKVGLIHKTDTNWRSFSHLFQSRNAPSESSGHGLQNGQSINDVLSLAQTHSMRETFLGRSDSQYWWKGVIWRFCSHLLQSRDAPSESSGYGLQEEHSIHDVLSLAQTHSDVGNMSRWVWFTILMKRRHLTLLQSSVPIKRCAFGKLWSWASKWAVNQWRALLGSDAQWCGKRV